MTHDTENIDALAAQTFSGQCTRYVGKQGTQWVQYFAFIDNDLIGNKNWRLIDTTRYSSIDSYKFVNLLKHGASVLYEREFTTCDGAEVVADRLFPPLSAPRLRASQPLNQLPTPFELLSGGVSETAAGRLSKFGRSGIQKFVSHLQGLLQQNPGNAVSDSDAFWLGWLITLGEEAYRQHAGDHPPFDNSWDAAVGEEVLTFLGDMEAALNPTQDRAQPGTAEVIAYPQSTLDLHQLRLDEAFQEAQYTIEDALQAYEAYKRGERSPDGGWPHPPFTPNPRTDAWYVAEVQPGHKFSIRFLSAQKNRYVESVACFLVRDGEQPRKLADAFVATHISALGTNLIRLEGPFFVTDASIPRFEVYFHKSIGGKAATVEELRQLLYLD